MSVATKPMIETIRKNENGRFVYRGITKADIIGYPTETEFEIWDDTEKFTTYHIPKI